MEPIVMSPLGARPIMPSTTPTDITNLYSPKNSSPKAGNISNTILGPLSIEAVKDQYSPFKPKVRGVSKQRKKRYSLYREYSEETRANELLKKYESQLSLTSPRRCIGTKDAIDRKLQKTLSKLPFDAQESVFSLLQLARLDTENAEKIALCQAAELLSLRSELKVKDTTESELRKSHDIYCERVTLLEEKLKVAQEIMRREKKFQHHNKRAVEVMSNTNKSLMSSLEALGVADSHDQMTVNSSPQTKDREPQLLSIPSSNKDSLCQMNRSIIPSSQQETHQNVANEKLRRSLLIVTREQNKLSKKNENLEETVHKMRKRFAQMEERCKALRSELEEYRTLPEDWTDEISKTSKVISADVLINNPTHTMMKVLPDTEEEFLERLRKQVLEPVETLLVLKKFICISSIAPDSLQEHDIAAHFLLSNLCSIFDCELMNIFILQAGDLMLKYDKKIGSNTNCMR